MTSCPLQRLPHNRVIVYQQERNPPQSSFSLVSVIGGEGKSIFSLKCIPSVPSRTSCPVDQTVTVQAAPHTVQPQLTLALISPALLWRNAADGSF